MMKTEYDCYIGILEKSGLVTLEESARMSTCLGQTILCSMIRKKFKNFPVRAYNLEVSSIENTKDDILKFIRNVNKPLVGLTLVAGNVNRSLELAKWLKKIGCTVIVGGPEIDERSARYYCQLEMIDGVVLGPGENIITEIVKNGLDSNIANLFTKKNPNPEIQNLLLDFKNIVVDYSLIFQIEKHEGVSTFYGSDCNLANDRCVFCGRRKMGFGWRNPKKVWREIGKAFRFYGIRKFYLVNDTVATNLQKFHEFAEAKPKYIKEIHMKCFIGTAQLKTEIIPDFLKVCAWITMGIESLTRTVAGKGNTELHHNYDALEIVSNTNLKTILTFVLGMPGETTQSLKKDVEAIKRLAKKHKEHIYMLTVSPLLVILGSKIFDQMYEELNGNLPRTGLEFYDPICLTKLYLKKYTGVTMEDLIRSIVELEQRMKLIYKIKFDSKGLDPKLYNKIKKKLDK